MLTDYELAIFLSSTGPCSLDHSPGSNWVQKGGGLPNFICHIARAIVQGGHGHDVSSAIAIAVSTAKRWAAGGTTNGHPDQHHVTAATSAKAARAVAQWEALKAKAHAGQLVKASNPMTFGTDLIMLASSDSYNLDMVRSAWYQLQSMAEYHQPGIDDASSLPDTDDDESAEDPKEEASETPAQEAAEEKAEAPEPAPRAFSLIAEMWSDCIIVEVFGGPDIDYFRVPYTVHDGEDVEFGDPVRVKKQWTEQPADELDDEELRLLKAELDEQHPDDLKLTAGPRTVRTPQGQEKYRQPVGSPIVKDTPQPADDQPAVNFARLVSLYREYKGFLSAGDHDHAQLALEKLRGAISHFPKTEKNQAALGKLHTLLHL